MSYCILIPARLNSKRMPEKNFADFNGQPLIDKTVEFATKFEFPIYVSTDAKEWKPEHPVIVINRPEVFARDDTDMKLVIEHAKYHIKEDVIILLQPTSPLRDEGLVRFCIEEYEDHMGGLNIVTVNNYTLKPTGSCFIFPKNRYIWDSKIWCIFPLPVSMRHNYIDIDYIWDFRIAEAIERENYS